MVKRHQPPIEKFRVITMKKESLKTMLSAIDDD
jgi:hypothetical protein